MNWKNILSNKVALVAGGAGDIGTNICLLLAKYGTTLIIATRSNSTSKDLIEIVKKTSPQSILVEDDFSSNEAWENLSKLIDKKFKQIDLLVHCIGIIYPQNFELLSKWQIENYIQTNLMSVIYSTKVVIPIMKKSGGGQIIILGSLGGIIPMPYETIYSATKFAVRGFCLSLSEELKNSGISLSLISPGPIKTKLLDQEAVDDKSTLAFVNSPLEPSLNSIGRYRQILYRKKYSLNVNGNW